MLCRAFATCPRAAGPPRVLRADLPRLWNADSAAARKKSCARFETAAEAAATLRHFLDEPAIDEETEAAPRSRFSMLCRGRLVGRAKELAEARQLWQRAQEGHGHAVLLSGEPGAGKTRLAREVTIQAAVDGAAVLSGGCYDMKRPLLTYHLSKRFAAWCENTKTTETAHNTRGRRAPDCEARAGDRNPSGSLCRAENCLRTKSVCSSSTPSFRSFRIWRAARVYCFMPTIFIGRTAAHFGDLATCCGSCAKSACLSSAAYRETELDRAHSLRAPSWIGTANGWSPESPFAVSAPRKRTNSSSALLGEKVSGEFGEAVYRETEGNPFFVEEVLKALIEKGSVRRESGRWKRCETGDLIIPRALKKRLGTDSTA